MDEFCKHLNIKRPPLVSLQSAITISSTTPRQDITSVQELPKYMLDRIMMLDCNSRRFPPFLNPPSQKKIKLADKLRSRSTVSSDNEALQIHPMDVFLFLFIQCDLIFRQSFITQVTKCQLSIPLITSHHSTHQPTFYLFSLRTLYKDYLMGDIGKSFSVTQEKLSIISFIRFGECGKSQKSELLNQIIEIPDYFFHRNQMGNTKNRFFLNGTVEIAWLLPRSQLSEVIVEPTKPCMVLNLRGNAWNHSKQLEFITTVSSLIYVFIPTNQCCQEFNAQLSNFYSQFRSKSVFVLYEGESIKQTDIEPSVPEFLGDLSDTLLFLEKNSLGEDANILSSNISSNIHNFPPFISSLDDCESIARRCNLNIDADELNITECQTAVDNTLSRMWKSLPNNQLKFKPLAIVKKSMLPLQGDCWSNWAEAKRESHKVTNREYQETMSKKMNEARLSQIEWLKTPSSILVDIINHCRTFGNSDSKFYLIWNLLRNDFNSLSITHLPPLYEEYKRWHKQSYSTDFESNLTLEQRNEKQVNSQRNLVFAAKNIAESSFGIEHIFRELGQVFEVHHSGSVIQKCDLESSLDFDIDSFKMIAAKLLIGGHAFEIVDGDVNHIAIKWVSCVLESLASSIGLKKKIFVVSILGTQSTGKSTLLNTMFGAKFPVSSGRCTRGIFMQLIPIEKELQTRLKYHYLVILDTEGLRAPELSINSSYRRDNELATIAVGLGDVTIINMSGEGHSEVQDILQIIIFALIRMKETYSKPRCVFVHQNVPDTHAHTNLISARSNLMKTLDKMTECAAIQEKKDSFYRKFADVIEFHPEEEVFYFPGLFEGEPPHNKISTGYSKRTSQLRQYLLECFNNSSDKQFQTVNEWSHKLQSLWKAVLEENFVFSFRNALEVTSRFELDHRISSWHSKYIQSLNNWKSNSLNELFNADVENLEHTWKRLTTELQNEKLAPLIETVSQNNLMKHYFTNHDNVEIFSQWKANTEMHFSNKRERHISKMENEYQKIYRLQKTKKQMDDNFARYRKDIIDKVHRLFKDLEKTGESIKDESLRDRKFKSIWDEWKSQIEVEKTELCDISTDLQKVLLDSRIIKSMHVLSIRQALIQNTEKFVAIGENDFQQLSTSYTQYQSNKKIAYYFLNDILRKLTIAIGYNLNIASIKVTSDAGTKQYRSSLGILYTECTRSINDYLAELTKSKSPYDPNYFHIIIDICYKILLKHNSTQKDNMHQSLQLTNDFIFDYTFYQCCKAIPVLQNIQDEFIKRTSLDYKFTQLEKKLKLTFIHLCDGIQTEYLCASELAKMTVSGMKDALRDIVPQEYFSVFMSDANNIATFTTRSSLILRILKDLARNKNFDDYISYIRDPINFLVDYVQKQLKEYSTRESILQVLKNRLLRLINSSIELYILGCSNACEQCTQSTPGVWLHFKKTFYSKIKSKVRNFSYNDLDVLDIHTISNYIQFNEFYCEKLRKIVSKTDWSVWIRNILKEEVSLYKNITDSILECEELCPFCNELCQLSCGEHEHYCGTFHRPKGLYGWHHIETETISLKECTTSIRCKRHFRYKEVRYEYVNYKTVNPRFRSWKILGEDAIEAKYWRWVLLQFEPKFLEYYDVKRNYQIYLWNSLTEEEVIKDLEDHFRNYIFKTD